MTATLDTYIHYISHSISAKLVIAILAICIATRISTARKHRSQTPNSPPYWVPYFGHSLHIFYDWRSFLASNTAYIHDGYLCPYILGRKATIILSSELTSSFISTQQSSIHSPSVLHFHLLRNVFGAPSDSKHLYNNNNEISPRLPDLFPPTPLPTHIIVDLISSRLPDLVSFNSHVVDQSPWERPASPETITHPHSLDRTRRAARVSLVTLITHFVGHVLGTAMLGANFMEQYPQVLDDLADLDAGFKYLALGLPRWVPPMSVAAAHIARKRLLAVLSGVQIALDQTARSEEPDELWGDVAEDLSEGVRERSRFWREKGASVGFRASVDLAVLWSTYAQATTLAVWMLIHIWISSELWAKIRIETSTSAKVTLGAKIMALSGSPRVDLDEAGLKSSCPLLLACLVECVQRYQWPQAAIYTTKDIHLTTQIYDDLHLEAKAFVICGAAPSISDQTAFERMAAVLDDDVGDHLGNQTEATLNTISTNATVVSTVLTTVAGVIALWEIMPTRTRSVILPVARSNSPCAKPASTFSVNLAQVDLNN